MSVKFKYSFPRAMVFFSFSLPMHNFVSVCIKTIIYLSEYFSLSYLRYSTNLYFISVLENPFQEQLQTSLTIGSSSYFFFLIYTFFE